MSSAVVVDCCRTPIGRAHPERGLFRDVRSDDLIAHLIKTLVSRTGIDPAEIEDVVLGCTQQSGEQGFNIARKAVLLAGLPIGTAGVTVNRLCGSSLQAINQAVHSIEAGYENVQIAGGLEHMHHLPMAEGLNLNPRLFHRTSKGALMMGVTAEFLAQSQGISRAAQDQFALTSHQHATQAHEAGKFNAEIIPTYGRNETGQRILTTQDQCVRSDGTLAQLAALNPAFLPKFGTVTAGNSSPLNDGAAALLMMSEERAQELGLKPLVRVRATGVAGVDPCVMGTGPVPATLKALKRAGLALDDLDLIELNEAFASQSLACIEMLKLDASKVNVHGGSLAIGHPLGASGARIVTTLIHAMVQQDATLGLATMCIGVGQGIATIFERV